MTALFSCAETPALYFIPIGNSDEIIFKGNVNLFFGIKVAPNLDINSMSFFILLLFKDLSPSIFTSMLGVVESNPISSLANVPEFPKFNFEFFYK